MAKYVDKEALEAKLNERLTYLLKKNGPYDHYTDGYDEAVSTVEDFPTADVAPVVRCRDCKHFNIGNMECENEAVSTDHEGGASYSLNFWLSDFCSYGEKKQEDA